MEELIQVIKSNRRISQMLQHCPLTILSKMKVLYFHEKKFNLHQGEEHPFVYLIVSGEVKVFVSNQNGKQIVLDVYTGGNLIGEHEAFLGTVYSASLQSLTDCLLIQISSEDFKEWASIDQTFSAELIESLCAQMFELTNRAAKYSLSSVRKQVLTALLESTDDSQKMSKRLVLDSVSSTPRSVYRVLSELEDSGLIELVGRDILIQNKKRLQEEERKEQ